MGVPISNVTRRVVYAASGTGPYAFTFEILANTDIAVYRDDTLLTLTTDYTVTIASNGTGSITLAAAPTGATQIAIVGNRTIQRTTDFVTGGDFFANTVNDEMDQQTIFAQQNAEGLQRALSAPQTDPTSINMTLPRASLRANKALGFDANGNPVIADTLGTNRGNWSAATLYYVRDIIKDTTNNNIWQCIVLHTSSGSQPINTNADSAKWTLLVDAASATTSATNAASSASAAATSATNAASSASAASTSASNASTSASNASSSASAAASSATSAAASFDSFDDRYLGAKSSDPTLDNDSNALIDGALYFDTTNNVMKVYDLGNTIWKRTTPTTSDQANIDAAVANATNINTVATNIANVNNVGGSITNVNTVAGSISSVNTNATNISSINTNAANITAIQNASTNATNAANSATAAATSATSAANSASSASAVALGNEPVRPLVRPTLLLDFANTRQLDPRITFTRASIGTFYDTFGILKTAASGTARFDHNPITEESLGLLIEEQRANLVLRSEEFDNAAWTKTRSSITANNTTAPDGASTADKLVEDTAAGSHTVRAATSATITSGTTLTASVYARAAEGNFVIVGIGDGAGVNISRTIFNLSTGAIVSSTTAPANVSAPAPIITSVGNGWYRCAITATVTGVTAAQLWIFKGANSNGNSSYTGDGASGIFIWGAQLEEGFFSTSYIPTVASQVTRAADVATMTSTNFSSWYNTAEGTIYSEGGIPYDYNVNYQTLYSLNDGASDSHIHLQIDSLFTNSIVSEVKISGSVQASFSPAYTSGNTKVSFAYKNNDVNSAKDGTAGTTDTSVSLPTNTQMNIGSNRTGGSILNGTIKKLAYFPQRVTDAQLQGMTTV